MRAQDIQVPLPMIDRSRSIAEASRVIADTGKQGVVVSDGGRPIGMITALDVFRLALPDYLLDDSSLAATLDEQSIDEMIAPLRDKTLGEVIDDDAVPLRPIPTVDSDATLLEVAAVLVNANSTLAIVGDSEGQRFVTLPIVLENTVRASGPADQSGGASFDQSSGAAFDQSGGAGR